MTFRTPTDNEPTTLASFTEKALQDGLLDPLVPRITDLAGAAVELAEAIHAKDVEAVYGNDDNNFGAYGRFTKLLLHEAHRLEQAGSIAADLLDNLHTTADEKKAMD